MSNFLNLRHDSILYQSGKIKKSEKVEIKTNPLFHSLTFKLLNFLNLFHPRQYQNLHRRFAHRRGRLSRRRV